MYFLPPLFLHKRDVGEILAPNIKSNERVSRTLLRENFERRLLQRKFLTFYTSAPSKREVSSFFLTPVKSNSRQGEHSENLSFISSVRKELSEVASDSCLETLRCKRQVGCSSGKGRDVAAVFAVFPEGKMKEGSP